MKASQYKGTFRLLVRAAKGSIVGFFGAAVFTIISAGFGFLRPQIIRMTIDNVIGNLPEQPGSVSGFLMDMLGGREFLSSNLIVCGAAILCTAAVGGLCSFVSRYCTGRTAEGVANKLRTTLYSHIQKLPFSWHTGIQTGDIIQRCTSDVDTIRGFLNSHVIELVRTIFIALSSFIIMFNMNRRMTLAAAICLPLIIIYSAVYYYYVSKRFREADEAEGLLSAIAQENLSGVRVIRAFGREKSEIDRFNTQNEIMSKKWIKLGDMLSVYWGLGDMVTGLQIMFVSIFGVMEAFNGNLSLGTFVAFVSYSNMMIWPLRGMGRILSEMSKARVSLSRLKDILDAKPETEQKDAKKPPVKSDIVFDNVSFSFEGAEKVLDSVSFEVPEGTTLGILGETGSGKSTLAHLLCRLYDLKEGEGSISVGGVDIRDIDRGYLRRNIGMVLQEPFLFSKSIRENIAPIDRGADLESVRSYARMACIDDSIVDFANGYDTVVGERGVTLSGGQRQRVAIARLLAQDSHVMIFDDSLSAVDTETDQKIRSELNRNLGGRTLMIISHRITTVMSADNIIVLSRGRIIEQGNHEELVKLGGVYSRIFSMQTSVGEEGGTI